MQLRVSNTTLISHTPRISPHFSDTLRVSLYRHADAKLILRSYRAGLPRHFLDKLLIVLVDAAISTHMLALLPFHLKVSAAISFSFIILPSQASSLLILDAHLFRALWMPSP
jgi:hypothetical protein